MKAAFELSTPREAFATITLTARVGEFLIAYDWLKKDPRGTEDSPVEYDNIKRAMREAIEKASAAFVGFGSEGE